MSTTPPPFGDPTNIQRENAEAVKKGVLVGCGGCAGVVAIGVVMLLLFVGGIFYFVFSMLRNAEPTQIAFRAAQNSEVLKREIGEPMTLGRFVSGSTKESGDSGEAELSVPVSGPKGDVSVQISASKVGGVWQVSNLSTVLPSGEKVMLQPSLSAPSGEVR